MALKFVILFVQEIDIVFSPEAIFCSLTCFNELQVTFFLPSFAFWLPGLVVVCCVLIELTVPPVNTLPEKTDTNDSMKVYKDPWVLMAAWNCAACQVKFFFQ